MASTEAAASRAVVNAVNTVKTIKEVPPKHVANMPEKIVVLKRSIVNVIADTDHIHSIT